MKPLAVIALTAVGLMGTATMAGERPMSFDGVGSMVLDMADEPETASRNSADADAEGCTAEREALEAKAEASRKEERTKLEGKEQAIAAAKYSELAKVGDAFLQEMAGLKVALEVVRADREEAAAFRREASVLQARAALEARREELKARLADIKDRHERQAVEAAEVALRSAHEAMVP